MFIGMALRGRRRWADPGFGWVFDPVGFRASRLDFRRKRQK